MIVLVTGGRNFYDHQCVKRALDRINEERCISLCIVGCADGADRWARNWSIQNEVDVHVYAARWKADGKRAGPLRNQRMVSEGKPNLCVAFPGGRGTTDCVKRARAAGVEVEEVKP